MRPTRKCEFCGKTFVPRSGMQKYCSEECQAEAKRLRKKRQQDLINGIEPIMELQHQEFLTFSKAAILMGCTRQYIYKLVANGKLKASRLSSRMAFVRKADIEKMFEGNPYKRVVPASKSKLSKKAKTEKPTQNQEPIKGKEENEVLDYYSGEEVMSIYKVKKSWLYTSAKRNQIPMCRIAGKNYYCKRHIDEFFGTAVDLNSITEWVTADDVEEAFSMSKSALRAYTYRHKIPTKREYGRTYYSKEHLEELRRTDLMSDDNYYTTEQVQQLYGVMYVTTRMQKTKDIVHNPISEEALELIGYSPDKRGKVFPDFKDSMTQAPLKNWLKDAGITKHISYHCSRHSFACLQLDAGTSIAVVQRYLGHKNVATTEVYAKISDAQKRASVGCITLKK